MIDKSLRRLVSAGLVALLLAGCAAPQGVVERLPDGQEPSELLSQAENQSGTEAARTRLQAADILARQGDNAQAIQIVKEIDASLLTPAERVERALLLSYLGLAQQDGRLVIEATSLLEGNIEIPRKDALTLRYRRGLALGMVGEPLPATKTLIGVQKDDPGFELNDEIWQQLTRLRGSSLQELANTQDPAVQGWLALLELQRRNSSDIARLFERIEEWRSTYPNHPAARRLPGDLQALRELRGRDVRHIAVFLPESGPLANVAKALREGIQARHMSALDQGEQTPQLSFYDTTGVDMQALYARAQMEGAQVVIGPLDKEQVSRLEVRNDVPLPTLALNYGTAPTNHAEGLFQYGLSAEDEARQVAQRAWRDGHRSAGMLVPDNPWGSRVSETFRQAWQELGGNVASLIRYNPEASVANAVKPLLNVRGERAQRNMDMLFLLALPSYARQVPPMLKFYYAGGLPIYATSHLYEGRPQPRVDHDLNNVMFVEIPWIIPDAAVGGEEALPYLDSYRKLRSDEEPALFKLKAMGVDAYELGRKLPLLMSLPGSEIYGATGTLSVGTDSRIHRELPWAQFSGGVPQPPLHNNASDPDPAGERATPDTAPPSEAPDTTGAGRSSDGA
ncbi:penicillin-binding protein activator [Modicisalibacter luteus]|uniref:Penicillin-binding protein activator n=1 Tax=Modicisalibacter luteus TaxID=453962 RepID=A0ABV7M3Y7_9GAMM|nr:penicillin-binding protein activator [Halomonas lutea]GHA91064.1 penicillin-binding protein activator [Halomonas lutea]